MAFFTIENAQIKVLGRSGQVSQSNAIFPFRRAIVPDNFLAQAILELAKDVVQKEREIPEEDTLDRGKAALTELFEQARNEKTPIMVQRIVDDIDAIVREVRFDGWQATHAGEREVKQVLRKTLFRFKLHQDTELFDRAYGYIREYY